MKTVAILSQKGGTGKTTLALHLAVAAAAAGEPALVLDGDPQGSAIGWRDSRAPIQPFVKRYHRGTLAAARAQAQADGIGWVLVDTAPQAGAAATEAAANADLILIPCRAGILDLRAIGVTAAIAQESRAPAFVVINHAPHRAPRLLDDVAEAVRHYGLALAPVTLHQRSAFGHALTLGLTASEYEPGGKADHEIRALLAWLRSRMVA